MPKTNGDKPFKCYLCSKTFARETTLYAHCRTEHNCKYDKRRGALFRSATASADSKRTKQIAELKSKLQSIEALKDIKPSMYAELKQEIDNKIAQINQQAMTTAQVELAMIENYKLLAEHLRLNHDVEALLNKVQQREHHDVFYSVFGKEIEVQINCTMNESTTYDIKVMHNGSIILLKDESIEWFYTAYKHVCNALAHICCDQLLAKQDDLLASNKQDKTGLLLIDHRNRYQEYMYECLEVQSKGLYPQIEDALLQVIPKLNHIITSAAQIRPKPQISGSD